MGGNLATRPIRVTGRETDQVCALGIGVAIAALTGLTYVTYNVVSVSFFYPHFLEDMIQAQFQMSQGTGMSAVQASQTLARLRAEITLPMIVRVTFAGFVIFGTALSALVAIAFRRRREGLPAAAVEA